jgi:hypothetical protein
MWVVNINQSSHQHFLMPSRCFVTLKQKMTEEERYSKEKEVLEKGLLQFRAFDRHVRNALINNEIIFGAAKNFNDPFDCNLPINISNSKSEITQYLKLVNVEKNLWMDNIELKRQVDFFSSNKNALSDFIRNDINGNSRFTCFNIFSEKQIFRNSLFWANYADKHHGICMKFNGKISYEKSFIKSDNEKVIPLPIEYCSKFPKFNYIKNRLEPWQKSGYSAQYYFGTKSINWKKEKEIRLIYRRRFEIDSDYVKVRFYPNLLEKVYIGCNLKDPEIVILLDILSKNEFKNVRISRLEKSNRSFRLIEKTIK